MAETETEEKTDSQTEGESGDENTGDEEKGDEEKGPVSYERFQEMVNKVKGLEDTIEANAEQAAIAKANPVAAPTQPTQPQTDPLDAIFKDAGLDLEDPDEVPTQGQLKTILSNVATVYDRQLAEMSFFQTHPDYTELIGTQDELASGQYAAPLAAAIKKNPALIQQIQKSADPRMAAYEIAKLQKAKAKPSEKVDTKEAKNAIDEAVENANKIKSSSNAKGGGGVTEEGRFASMSDGDFLKLAADNGAIL